MKVKLSGFRTLARERLEGSTSSNEYDPVWGNLDAMYAQLDVFINPDIGTSLFGQWLSSLVRARSNTKRRRDEVEALLLRESDHFFGWNQLLASRSTLYQLDREHAWWHPSATENFHTANEERVALESRQADPHDFLRAGFVLLPQEIYRLHAKVPILEALLETRNEVLLGLGSWTLALSGSRSFEWSEGAVVIDDHELGGWISGLKRRWRRAQSPRSVALPRPQLATLTRESHVLQSLVTEQVHPNASAMFHQDDAGQLLLVYDKRFVGQPKDQRKWERYLELRVPGEPVDPANTEATFLGLCRGLQSLGKMTAKSRRQHIMDIPRVLAGMFRAAAMDHDFHEHLQKPGEFWGRSSGLRLTDLIGLNNRWDRDRKRVQAVRSWLERIQFVRNVDQVDDRGKRVQGRYEAPIVHKLPDTFTLTRTHTRGEYQCGKANLWRIPEPIWQLRTSTSDVANFMLLDERAFALDSSSSEPFNLYWTIVQRAYMSPCARNEEEQMKRDGSFSPRLFMLYDHAGLELPADVNNPGRIKLRLIEYLGRLVSAGLLLDWSCDFLTNELPFDREAFLAARVRLVLPGQFLKHLQDTPETLDLAV